MNKRGFLRSIIAAGVAPAFVGASVLMPIRDLSRPILWGDGIHDDWEALTAAMDGRRVTNMSDADLLISRESTWLSGGTFRFTKTLYFPNDGRERLFAHGYFKYDPEDFDAWAFEKPSRLNPEPFEPLNYRPPQQSPSMKLAIEWAEQKRRAQGYIV